MYLCEISQSSLIVGAREYFSYSSLVKKGVSGTGRSSLTIQVTQRQAHNRKENTHETKQLRWLLVVSSDSITLTIGGEL